MDAVECITTRRSVRRFTDRPVDDGTIRELLSAAVAAPNGGNRQGWFFVVVRDADRIARMATAVRERIAAVADDITSDRARKQYDAYTAWFTAFEGAPVVIAVLARPYDSIYTRILRKYCDDVPGAEMVDVAQQSAAAAVENILLAAHARGLGACWMTGATVAQDALEAELAVRAPWRLTALVPVGHVDEAPASERDRKPLDDVVSFETFPSDGP